MLAKLICGGGAGFQCTVCGLHLDVNAVLEEDRATTVQIKRGAVATSQPYRFPGCQESVGISPFPFLRQRRSWFYRLPSVRNTAEPIAAKRKTAPVIRLAWSCDLGIRYLPAGQANPRSLTGGIFQVPSRIEGGVSFGQ